MRTCIAVMAILLVGSAALAKPKMTFETYSLNTTDVAPIMELIGTMVGEEGKVIHDARNARLLVMATPVDHKEIAKVLKAINVPAPNVRINVNISKTSEKRESGAGMTGGGHVVMTPGGPTYHGHLKPHMKHQSSSRDENVGQMLLVQSGGKASIKVATEVPFEEWLIHYGRRRGYIEQKIAMREVGASLVVQPHVFADGKMIKVKVIPELSGLVDGKRQTIQYTHAVTELTVGSGQTVNIGGVGESKEFYDRFLMGFGRGGERKNVNISLTATAE